MYTIRRIFKEATKRVAGGVRVFPGLRAATVITLSRIIRHKTAPGTASLFSGVSPERHKGLHLAAMRRLALPCQSQQGGTAPRRGPPHLSDYLRPELEMRPERIET